MEDQLYVVLARKETLISSFTCLELFFVVLGLVCFFFSFQEDIPRLIKMYLELKFSWEFAVFLMI